MNQSVKNLRTAEQVIGSVYDALHAEVAENLAVVKEKPGKMALCKGMICVYKRSDLERQKMERGCKALPVTRYVFYSNIYHPDCVGSVAIYGDNAASVCRLLRRQGMFFGIPILSAEVGMGRRPFVDIRLNLLH